jgi:hypothetical protein
MREPTAATVIPPETTSGAEAPIESLEAALRSGGEDLALERLVDHLDRTGEFRAMLDALLLKARRELGLPLVAVGSLADLQEPMRTQYEEKYVAAIRLVGSRHLDQGDIATAWAYFRAIAEPEPVAKAIAALDLGPDDERLGAIIEVAFNHGVSPARGLELIIKHYGTCPAISAFEQLPAHDQATRIACAQKLIQHLHGELTANIRSEIAARGQVVPPAGTSIAGLIAGRPWLFADESYHIDISHLAAVVRMSLIATDPAMIALAEDLCQYGRSLSPRLVFDGSPPFEHIFEDHGVYLRAVLGREVDQAIAHFERKLADAGNGEQETTPMAEVLVNLLMSAGRIDEAIEVAAAQLFGVPDSTLSCPSLAQLCQRAGRTERLAQIAREHGDLVTYMAARLEQGRGQALALTSVAVASASELH